jgi:cyclophilin family peptidyl-prolyl cis-trans isomerase
VIALLVIAISRPAPATIVRFQTSSGNVDVRLYNAATPLSVTNFLNYVTTNRYNGTFIHRVPQSGGASADFVVQGGGFLLNNSIFAAAGIVTDPPIGNEPKFSNTRGTLSFAKNNLGATSQWFFNIGDNSFLDAQAFTVFGRVLGSGMTVVDAINDLPVVNATSAQNAAGEDFDEIPVRDIQQVINQQDITANEAVMVNVSVLNLPAGDYDFNGVVNATDYNLWRSNYGSTTNAAPDGNGDGVVNAADYVVWRNSLAPGAAAGASELALNGVPEPSITVLLAIGGLFLPSRRRRPWVHGD